MKHRYALRGVSTKELISFQGRVLVHDNVRELEWVFRGPVEVIQISARFASERPVMRLKDHPDMASCTWPLNQADFK